MLCQGAGLSAEGAQWGDRPTLPLGFNFPVKKTYIVPEKSLLAVHSSTIWIPFFKIA